jgi:hypothetical protein
MTLEQFIRSCERVWFRMEITTGPGGILAVISADGIEEHFTLSIFEDIAFGPETLDRLAIARRQAREAREAA